MLHKLVLGTAQLGRAYGIANKVGTLSSEQAHALLEAAWRSGIRWLDTAPAYGDALAGIGTFHRALGVSFNVISKFSRGYSAGTVEASVREQLARLGIARLEVLEFHSLAELQRHPELLAEARLLQEEGWIGKVGVSVYGNDELAAALTLGVEVLQLPFNLLDNMTLRGALMEQAATRGVELHARSVYLQGLLLMPPERFPPGLRPLAPYLSRLAELAARYNRSLQELALLYVFQNSFFTKIILGMEEPQQITENLRLLDKEGLSRECIEAIEAIEVRETSLLNPSHWMMTESAP